MIDWHWEVFFYYKLKRWGCELTVSQTPTFIIEPKKKIRVLIILSTLFLFRKILCKLHNESFCGGQMMVRDNIFLKFFDIFVAIQNDIY